MARDSLLCASGHARGLRTGGSLYLSPITTLDQTCQTLSNERDAPILALIIQLKYNLMLFIRVPCSCTLMNFAETSTRPEKNFPFSGIGGADPILLLISSERFRW